MKTLHVILGNCLFDDISSLHIQKEDIVVMIEDRDLCTHFTYHKHKIILFLSAMRNYRDELEKKVDNQIVYIKIDDNTKTYFENLKEIILENNISNISTYDIEDNFFKNQFNEFVKVENLNLKIIKSLGFITSHEEFMVYAQSYKRLFMNDFYQWQRKRLNILVDSHKQPLHGKWSFDDENRKPLPKNITIPNDPNIVTQNSHLKNVVEIVDKLFSNHPGNSDNFWLPTTRDESLKWLDDFIVNKFEKFGPYEDAIHSTETFLFHSVLSPVINCGLLTPQEVLDKVLEYNLEHEVHYPSLEGFVRQLIGWREFVRGCYHYIDYEKKELSNELNELKHTRKLSSHFYDGTTGILPLDDTIKKVIKFGYTHHIERLMIVGNIMLLCEIDPKDVYKWFMEMYVDSSDWVMAPNVYSMSQFSDFGIQNGGFATKPYIGGSNYICKMSNYSKNDDWCEIVDGLYWRFIDKKREIFLKNPRMGMMVKLYDKMDEEKKLRLKNKAEEFLEKIS